MNVEAGPSAAGRFHVQITPPGSGGVRDHALALQRTWGQTGSPGWLWSLDLHGAQQVSLAARLAPLAARAPVAVLVHFSGYGYGERGLCGWLVREIAQARQALGSRLRIVAHFHELFASGPPWQSSFWLQPWQRMVARQLLAQCDAAVTNTEGHCRWLHNSAGDQTPLLTMPVFSNVGEPAAYPLPSVRPADLILFGAHATRARASVNLSRCVQLLRQLGVCQITEIGPGASTLCAALPLQHRHLGAVDAAELSAHLQRHRFACIDYPVRYLAKSSVFAAYAAHGCVVLNTARPAPSADGLSSGVHEHHLSANLQAISDAAGLDRSAGALKDWYARHTLATQARRHQALLDQVTHVQR